jgi:phospholipase C
VFAQAGYYPGGTDPGRLRPFHLRTDVPGINGECTNDISHEWIVQHQSWNGGAMDRFVSAHVDPKVNGPANGPLTMGYYTSEDIGYYYALAAAFTLCDGFHCSVIGPTDPNRLYTMTGTIDPDGHHGGPLLETLVGTRLQNTGKFSWQTMPEVLQSHGVSWKIYQTPDAALDNILPYFAAYTTHVTDPGLPLKGLLPVFPLQFLTDVALGTLPQVSWVLAPVVQSEHPGAPPAYGEVAVSQVLNALLSKPALWEKTALLVTYDENGGFFDHVPPPTAPSGTPGEWLTVPVGQVSKSGGIAGPIGLGFRVPMMVISPFSKGGFVSSDTFDHTSVLRFIARRFGVPLPTTDGQPNISDWRMNAVGDLTSAFNFAATDPSRPGLPAPPSLVDPNILRQCALNGLLGTLDRAKPYPVPPNSMPVQPAGTPRRPSGVVSCPT